MSFIIAILLGALVGYIGSRIAGRREGFLASTIIGVIGAVVGNVISRAVGVGNQAGLTFDLSSLLWSVGGAVVVVFVLNWIQGRKTQ